MRTSTLENGDVIHCLRHSELEFVEVVRLPRHGRLVGSLGRNYDALDLAEQIHDRAENEATAVQTVRHHGCVQEIPARCKNVFNSFHATRNLLLPG